MGTAEAAKKTVGTFLSISGRSPSDLTERSFRWRGLIYGRRRWMGTLNPSAKLS